MKLLKYLILFLVICNIPSYLLAHFGASLGAIGSYLSSLSIIGFFVLVKERHKPPWPFIALGLLFFLISSINYTLYDPDNYFIKDFTRFMIVVLCGGAVLRRTSDKELFYIFLIGATSVIINAVFLPTMQIERFGENYGRFSGFYLNPNLAGGTCLLGYAFSYSVRNVKWKLIGQIVFTLAGILTFSRTFIIVWSLISIISIYNDKRNLYAPIIGAVLLAAVIVFSGRLTLNTKRFSAIESIFTKEKSNTAALKKDTRDDTWAMYYDLIFDKPFMGHGFKEFKIKKPGLPGVHNTFLLVIGEAGIIPFLLLLSIYLQLLSKSYAFVKTHPGYFYVTIVLILSMMTGHGYFVNFFTVLISMYVFIKLQKYSLDGKNLNTLVK